MDFDLGVVFGEIVSLSQKNNSDNNSIDGYGFTENNTIGDIFISHHAILSKCKRVRNEILAYLIKFLDLILGILMAEPNKLLPVMKIPL